jgi:Cu(I)/Ag(I) efflux system periplasmic protein CusF
MMPQMIRKAWLRRAAAFCVVAMALVVAGVANAQTTDWIEGEVRRVNDADGKVTLRHGPLPELDMPGMTMVFTARDRAVMRDEGSKKGKRK